MKRFSEPNGTNISRVWTCFCEHVNTNESFFFNTKTWSLLMGYGISSGCLRLTKVTSVFLSARILKWHVTDSWVLTLLKENRVWISQLIAVSEVQSTSHSRTVWTWWRFMPNVRKYFALKRSSIQKRTPKMHNVFSSYPLKIIPRVSSEYQKPWQQAAKTPWQQAAKTFRYIFTYDCTINPLNAELNPICYLLALLGVHHFLHVSKITVKSLTLRLPMSYIHIYIYIYIYIYIWSTYS